MRWLCGALLMTAPVAAQAPTLPAADTLSMWLIRGADTVPIGRQVHRFTVRRESAGSLLFRVIFTDAMLFGPRIDTLISNLASGMPVRYVAATPRSVERVDVLDGRARGRILGPDNQPMDLDLSVPEGAIHAGNIDLDLRSRLLPIGSVLTLRVFLPAPSGGGDVAMRVEAVETVGSHAAWRIRALNLANALTFWISQRDRSLVRQTMMGPGGEQLLLDRRPLPPQPLPR